MKQHACKSRFQQSCHLILVCMIVCLCSDLLIQLQIFSKCQFIILSDHGSDSTCRTYRIDHSFVTFLSCWAVLWIAVPTLYHQPFPEGWRRSATLLVNWAVTFIDPIKQILWCCSQIVSKDPLSVPHLPHYQPQAVDVCLGAVHSGMKHFRCCINGRSLKSAGDVYFCFSHTNVSNFHCVFFRQLKWNKKKFAEDCDNYQIFPYFSQY